MALWPFRHRQSKPNHYENAATFYRIEFDDFAGFSDDAELRDKYPTHFEDIYDPRFDDFYQ